MKVFKHTKKDWKVLLYSNDNDVMRVSFLMDEKPKVGDIFQSYELRETNFVWTYEITEILQQRDSVENNLKPEHQHLRKDASITFKFLRLNKVLDNGVVSGEFIKDIGIELDCSIGGFW